jgi:hypothetical protein
MSRAALVVAIALPVLSGCPRTRPVRNVAHTFADPTSTIGAQALSEVISVAAARSGWRREDVRPGEARLDRSKGHHHAVTQIDYDENGYRLTLLEATDLKYDGTQVHWAYNSWIAELERAIGSELRYRYGDRADAMMR